MTMRVQQPRRHPMPEIAAFVANLKSAFGVREIDEAIRRGKAGEPVPAKRVNAPVIKPAPGKKYDDFQLSYALDLINGKMTVAAATDPAQLQLQRRAMYWYEQALVNLTGLNRTKALKRIDKVSARLSGAGTGRLKHFTVASRWATTAA